MKNTPSNLAALSEMAAACEGTPWELRFRASDEHDWVHTRLSVRPDALEYTPEVYLDTDWYGTGRLSIKVQTTSYGALSISEIERVAAGLTQAAQLVRRLRNIAELAGLKVQADRTL